MLPNGFKEGVEQFLAQVTGKANTQLQDVTTVSGGCINNACRLETTEGVFFLKYNDANRYPGMFNVEAKGLKRLHMTEAIHVPEVIGVDEAEGRSYIILEYIESGRRQEDFWEDFGASLARLHLHSNSHFGLDYDNYIGSLRQYNNPNQNWTDFFIEQRLEKQLQLALQQGNIGLRHEEQFNRLFKLLPGIFPEEPPALLHGDLWSGNVMAGTDGRVCVLDPAVYYGHREMELAFTGLFGGFDLRFYAAYDAVYPLEKDYEERRDIYNLYPLMVHVNLFGGGYLSSVETILKRYLGN